MQRSTKMHAQSAMSRSAFLKGSASVVAGLAVAGAASNAAIAAENIETWDMEADVVAVGAGAAGLMACQGAHEMGATSILFEKNGIVGGDSLLSDQDILACWPERTLADSGTVDTYEQYLADWKLTHERASVKGLRGEPLPDEYPCVERYLQSWPEVGNWLVDVAGVDFSPILMGSSMPVDETIEPRTWHGDLNHPITVCINEVLDTYDDVQIFVNHEIVSLIQDETGRVVGVAGVDDQGNAINVKANKGVIISTGTFCANPFMVSHYIDPDYALCATAGMISCSGDGIRMAQGVGAALVDMDLGMNFENTPVGAPYIMYLDDYMGNFSVADDALAPNNPAICVNLEGKRFFNESLGYCAMGRNTASQPHRLSFYVCDSKLDTAFLDDCDVVLWGDTLEELAAKMCVPADVFAETVARYNGFVEAGVDEDFGKTLDGVWPLETGPFYALIIQPRPYITLGGIKTDVDSHVIDVDGNVIPGLYAAGVCCGSYWEQEGFVYYGGLNQALVFGLQAGRIAAGE